MKKHLIILLFILINILYSCGQSTKSSSGKATNELTTDSIKLDETVIKNEPFSMDRYVHTEADYTDTTGKGIIIQNSYPRGGGPLPTPSGASYGHAVFWSRVINKTDTPLSLQIHFPADSFLVLPSPTIHFKLLVPPDTMTLDKVSTFSFGLENIQSFVYRNFYQVSELQRSIPPNEDAMFYVILLSHLSNNEQGVGRTGLFLEGRELFYKLSVNADVFKVLPCGKVAFED